MNDITQHQKLVTDLLCQGSKQGCLVPSLFRHTLEQLSDQEFTKFADAVLELSFWSKTHGKT